MNAPLKHFATSCLCLALAGLAAPVAAQETRRESRIVVVNVERLLTESAHAKAIAAHIEADFAPRRQRIQLDVRRLRELSDKLQHDASALNEREHLMRAREVGELERSVRREQAKLKEDLLERRMKEHKRMAARINEVIATVREQQGAELVLTRTVWHRSAIDITDKVASMLDR